MFVLVCTFTNCISFMRGSFTVCWLLPCRLPHLILISWEAGDVQATVRRSVTL